MKKIILILFLFVVYQVPVFPQLVNPNFTNKQKNEIKSLNRSFILLNKLLEKNLKTEKIIPNKRKKIVSIDEGGIKSSLIEVWLNNAWTNSKLTTFFFDANKNETGFLIQSWDVNKWVNDINYGITLDDDAKPIIDSMQVWRDDKWENFFKHFYSYNANNDMIEWLTKIWNDTTDTWEEMMKSVLTYDSEFKLIEDSSMMWSDTGWSPFSRDFYSYNDKNLLVSHISQNWMETEWVDWDRVTFTYNNKDLLIDRLTESWLFFSNKWANSNRYQYEYNSDDLEVVRIIEEWDMFTEQQTRHDKISTTYSDTLMIEELTQQWDGSTWVNSDLETYSYEDNQITLILWQKWDNNNWVNFQRTTNTYGSPVSVEYNKTLPADISLLQNYPNPFNPSTIIEYTIPNAASANVAADFSQRITLNVYNILGREVTTLVNDEKQPGTYKVIFNAKDLPSGLYLYRLKIGNQAITKKCLLLK